MVRTDGKWSLPRLSQVLLFAVTVSAQSLTIRSPISLANFQVIASNAVPRSCIQVYDRPMTTCTRNDFAEGQTCSAGCVQELAAMEREVQNACQGVRISQNTVLGQIMLGGLVQMLCPTAGSFQGGGDEATTATTQRQSPPTTIIRTTRQTSTTILLQPTRSTSTPVAAETSPPPQADPVPAQTTPFVIPTRSQSSAQTSRTPETEILPGGSPFDLPPEQRGFSAGHKTLPGWGAGLALAVSLLLLLR